MNELIKLGKGSTAASTDFVYERIDGPDGRYLFFDGNQKISGWVPRPNAFSLVEIQDCPFRTPSCEVACYVHGLKKHAPHVHELYEHNSLTVRQILAGSTSDRIIWRRVIASWIRQHCAETGFRWHVSGDIFSLEYAQFIAEIVRKSPSIRHWIYTRSFPFLAPLLPLENLAINLSCDADNYWLAKRYADSRGLRLCYLTRDGSVPADLPRGSVIFPDYGLRERDLAPAEARGESSWWQSLSGDQRNGVCPVDFYGKAEHRRCALEGACNKCLV